MVSEKVIVVLLVIAIVLSVVSVMVTLSTLNDEIIPTELKVRGDTEDSASGRISIIIEPPLDQGEGG